MSSLFWDAHAVAPAALRLPSGVCGSLAAAAAAAGCGGLVAGSAAVAARLNHRCLAQWCCGGLEVLFPTGKLRSA